MTLSRLSRISRHRLRSLFRQSAADAEVARELAFHYDLLVSEQIASGMPPEEARRAARQALGNVALLEEQCRDHRRVSWLHDLRQDLRYGWRMLRRSPVFTAIAAASLALGIGANTATLAVIDAVFLEPFGYPHGDRLVVVRTGARDPARPTNASLAEYLEWKGRGRLFESMGTSIAYPSDFAAERNGPPAERVHGLLVDPDLLATLGVTPLLGRLFSDEDPELGRARSVIIISHRLWRRRFTSDPAIVGREVRLDRTAASIVGVMPETFGFMDRRNDYWAPLRPSERALGDTNRLYLVLGRLRPGVTIAQAEAELTAIARSDADATGQHAGARVRVQRLRDVLLGWTATPLMTVAVAVALVLLLACANVAGLLLARGTVRSPELALRMAIGAGRGRIIRQLLTETLFLSLIGGALGLAVAWAGVRGLRMMAPLPGAMAIPAVDLGGRVPIILLVLSLVSGVISGIAPALASTRPGRRDALAGAGRAPSPPHGQTRLRHLLVGVQVALSVVLLVNAMLLTKSFVRLAGRDMNFDPRGLAMLEYRIPISDYLRPLGTKGGQLHFALRPPPSLEIARVHERLRALPGVESVGGISSHPTNTFVLPRMHVTLDRRAAPDGDDSDARPPVYFFVTPDFFQAMRTPIVRGRELRAGDTVSAPWVAVVNESMARRFWPGEDPVGKRLTLDAVPEEQPREVVGVVRDIPTRREQTSGEPIIYASYLQQPARYRAPFAGMFGHMLFVLRGTGDSSGLALEAQRAVAEIDADRPLAIVTRAEEGDRYLTARHSYVFVLAVLAIAATLLATMGVYGVVAFDVAQRIREIGVRLALGASHREVLVAVAGRVLLLTGTGLAAGLVAAFWLSRFTASQLWGITATDSATFATVSLLLLLAGGVACVLPIRRAVRAGAAVALKAD